MWDCWLSSSKWSSRGKVEKVERGIDSSIKRVDWIAEGAVNIHKLIKEKTREKAVLVGVVLPGMTRYQEEESLDELAALAETAGAEVLERILQDRHGAHPATLIGKGKVRQVVRRVADLGAGLVVFDTDLSPVQVKNLEREIKCKILDRSGLILDIFASRARTREAQIQVELAQLQYLLPRLTRRWTHLERQEAGIGTRGPGETQLEVDRRVIRKRIGHLKDALGKIEMQRTVRRRSRREKRRIALVGYTNVGKSSLLNALSDAEVFVENRLFATLDATIRTMAFKGGDNALLIDTVGFIRKLPPHLVASFRSTLEETVEADLLLHVVDVNHSNFEEQTGSVQEVLRDLGIADKPTIMVFNKVDLLEDRRLLGRLKQRYQRAVFTSAVKGMGLEALRDEIGAVFAEEEFEMEVRVPTNETRIISRIHALAKVVQTVYEDGMAVIRFRATSVNKDRIHALTEDGKDEHSGHR